MQIQYQTHQGPRGFGWLLAIPLLMVAAVFGLVVLAMVVGLALLAAAVLGVRMWRMRRRQRRAPVSQVLQGEYVVVREARRDPPRS